MDPNCTAPGQPEAVGAQRQSGHASRDDRAARPGRRRVPLCATDRDNDGRSATLMLRRPSGGATAGIRAPSIANHAALEQAACD